MKNKIHILVLMSFLGGIIAPACGFMWGGNYSVVEICTTQGLENRLVIDEGSNDAPSPQMQDQCEFCFSHTNLTALLSNINGVEKTRYTKQKLQINQYEAFVLSRLSTNTSPRGPPAII